MGDIHDLGEAFSWSVSRLADCFGVHRQTMTKKLKEAGVKPTGEHRGNPVYHIADVAKLLYGPRTAGDPGLDLDQFPEARKAWYQSELYRVQLEEKLGDLIPETEHVRCLASMAKSVAAMLDSLPDVLERDGGLAPDALVLITEVLDDQRAKLAEDARKALSDEG